MKMLKNLTLHSIFMVAAFAFVTMNLVAVVQATDNGSVFAPASNNDTEEEGNVLGANDCEIKEGTLSGRVYNMDANDEGVDGVRVEVYYFDEDNDRVLLDRVRTDENGEYEVSVCLGSYEIEILRSSLNGDYSVSGNAVLAVTVDSDNTEASDLDFALTELDAADVSTTSADDSDEDSDSDSEEDDDGFNPLFIIIPAIIAILALLGLAAASRRRQ